MVGSHRLLRFAHVPFNKHFCSNRIEKEIDMLDDGKTNTKPIGISCFTWLDHSSVVPLTVDLFILAICIYIWENYIFLLSLVTFIFIFLFPSYRDFCSLSLLCILFLDFLVIECSRSHYE